MRTAQSSGGSTASPTGPARDRAPSPVNEVQAAPGAATEQGACLAPDERCGDEKGIERPAMGAMSHSPTFGPMSQSRGATASGGSSSTNPLHRVSPLDIRQGYRSAQAVTRQHAKTFSFASVVLPKARRRAAFALYAFCRRLDELVDEGSNEGLPERLTAARATVSQLYVGLPELAVPTWVRESSALSRPLHAQSASDRGSAALTPSGLPSGSDAMSLFKSRCRQSESGMSVKPGTYCEPSTTPWPDHELAALVDAIARFRIPEQPFQDLISGMEMDLVKTRYATFAELDLYCYRVAGTVGLLMTPVLGYCDERALQRAVDLGKAMQLTNILRDIGEDLGRGRVYLPADELQAFGLSERSLVEGQVDEAFVAMMQFQIKRAREAFARGAAGIRFLNGFGSQRMVRLMGATYAGILGAIEAQRYDVFRGRAHVPLRRKLATLLQVLVAPSTVLGAERPMLSPRTIPQLTRGVS